MVELTFMNEEVHLIYGVGGNLIISLADHNAMLVFRPKHLTIVGIAKVQMIALGLYR
jgi:hypothetical protein